MQKSKKPEKIVEAEVMSWLHQNGFSCNVVESKAVYSQKAGRYISGQTVAGMSDIVGVDPVGRACFIELKAKGKRNNLAMSQYVFLQAKIEKHAFGVVVDSADLLEKYYKSFCSFIKDADHNGARNYLREILPTNSIIEMMDRDLDFED
jgi:hypothetical protein